MRWNRYQLGDWLELVVQTTNGAGTPTPPDNCPTAKIFSGAGSLIDTVTIPVVHKPSGTEYYFERRWRLGSSYAAGAYMVVIEYTTTSGAYVCKDLSTFHIAAGGNTEGACIGSYWHSVPEAEQVCYQADGGRMLSRRFPRL